MNNEQNFIKQHNQQLGDNKKEIANNIPLEEIGWDLINAETELTILKIYARRLGLPNFSKYNQLGINQLKQDLSNLITERLMSGLEPLDTTSDAEQNAKLKDFIKKFRKGERVSGDYNGPIEKKFMQLFNGLDIFKQKQFAEDFMKLNHGKSTIGNKQTIPLNPLPYLELFISSLTHIDTSHSLALRYLELFLKKHIKNDGDDREVDDEKNIDFEIRKIEENEKMPKEFLRKFKELSLEDQVKFAGDYSIVYRYLDPRDGLKLFLQNKSSEPRNYQAQRLFIGGINEKRENNRRLSAGKENTNARQKCKKNLSQNRWIIREVTESNNMQYKGASRGENWFIANEKFYEDVCLYNTYVKSPTEPILVIAHESRKMEFYVKKDGSSNYTATELATDLKKAQTNNIFAKLAPFWILETPVYELDDVYFNTLSDILYETRENKSLGNVFDPVIQKIRTQSRNETYLTYLLRVLTMFFPFMKNSLENGLENGSSYDFFVVKRVNEGYITMEAFMNMSLQEKVPEANIDELVKSLENYLPTFAYETIQSVDSRSVNDSRLKFNSNVFRKVECPEKDEWKPQDLIIYEDRCFSLPTLIRNFKENNIVNPYSQENFDLDFVNNIMETYSNIQKFVKISGEEVSLVEEVPDSPPDAPSDVPDVSSDILDDIMIVPVDETKTDNIAIFNSYFNIEKYIVDPHELILDLMHFTTVCRNCNKLIKNNNAQTSILDKTDGKTIQGHFCDFKCMSDYKFIPIEVQDESRVSQQRSGTEARGTERRETEARGTVNENIGERVSLRNIIDEI